VTDVSGLHVIALVVLVFAAVYALGAIGLRVLTRRRPFRRVAQLDRWGSDGFIEGDVVASRGTVPAPFTEIPCVTACAHVFTAPRHSTAFRIVMPETIAELAVGGPFEIDDGTARITVERGTPVEMHSMRTELRELPTPLLARILALTSVTPRPSDAPFIVIERLLAPGDRVLARVSRVQDARWRVDSVTVDLREARLAQQSDASFAMSALLLFVGLALLAIARA
jgi:hypothetical protein